MPVSLLLISTVIIVLDQATKALALLFLPKIPTVPLIPGIFHLTLVHNTGVAFGLLKGYRVPVLWGTAFLIVGLFFYVLRTWKWKRAGWNWSLGLILGGAVGNLVDRLRFNAVIDFLDFRIWPVFNIADSCITIGAFFLAWQLLRHRER